MTILSISVCTNTSKIIFARQFVEMTRKGLEELIVLFSRSVNLHKQVTSFETENNRFLYIYSDPLYLVVITTKDSNIIEDMEVLKLSNRLMIDICSVGKLIDTEVIKKAFEIALGLDEIVSFGTYEGLNLMQVKNLLKMDSAEEKEFRKIQLQREKHAKEQLDARMLELEEQRRKNVYFSDAIGSDTIQCGGGNDFSSNRKSSSDNKNEISNFVQKETKEDVFDTRSTKKPGKSKGLTLGKKKIDTKVQEKEIKEVMGNYFF